MNVSKLKHDVNFISSTASLNNYKYSPRKMRLIIDVIRGLDIDKALNILKHINKKGSVAIEKLLLSCISNWQCKNKNYSIDDVILYISYIVVNCGKTLKRLRPAPQGRGHKVRKRFCQVKVIIEVK
jgi:large subunit ribosomal protein L22